MKIIRRHRNKDGSVTKTTIYRRRTLFGTIISDSYTERIGPKSHGRRAKNKLSYTEKSQIMTAAGVIFFIGTAANGLIGAAAVSAAAAGAGVYRLAAERRSADKSDGAERAAVPVSGNGWICPCCGTVNSKYAKSCRDCGEYK